jgi:hypothetical protein
LTGELLSKPGLPFVCIVRRFSHFDAPGRRLGIKKRLGALITAQTARYSSGAIRKLIEDESGSLKQQRVDLPRCGFDNRAPNQTATFAACDGAASDANTASIFCASLDLSCTHSPRLIKILP